MYNAPVLDLNMEVCDGSSCYKKYIILKAGEQALEEYYNP